MEAGTVAGVCLVKLEAESRANSELQLLLAAHLLLLAGVQRGGEGAETSRLFRAKGKQELLQISAHLHAEATDKHSGLELLISPQQPDKDKTFSRLDEQR